jgi:hypothetical protein
MTDLLQTIVPNYTPLVKYFVSMTWWDERERFANAVLQSPEITDGDVLQNIAHQLEAEIGKQPVVILNFVRLP